MHFCSRSRWRKACVRHVPYVVFYERSGGRGRRKERRHKDFLFALLSVTTSGIAYLTQLTVLISFPVVILPLYG